MCSCPKSLFLISGITVCVCVRNIKDGLDESEFGILLM